MLVPESIIKSDMQRKKYYYWQLKNADDKVLTEYDGKAEFNSAWKELEELLHAIKYGVYTVRLRKAKGKENKGRTLRSYSEFEIECGDRSAAPVSGTQTIREINNTVTQADDSRFLALQEEFNKLKLEREEEKFKALKEEISALKQGINDLIEAWNSEEEVEAAPVGNIEPEPGSQEAMWKEIMPEIKGILQEIRPAISKRIANKISPGSGENIKYRNVADNVTEVAKKQIEADKETKLKAHFMAQAEIGGHALMDLLHVDSEAGTHLQMLARLAKNQPLVYKAALAQLKEHDKEGAVETENAENA